MAVTTTVLSIPSQNSAFQIPGDYSPEDLKRMYAGHITGLDAMVSESSGSLSPDGEIRTVTFKPRTGNKG